MRGQLMVSKLRGCQCIRNYETEVYKEIVKSNARYMVSFVGFLLISLKV